MVGGPPIFPGYAPQIPWQQNPLPPQAWSQNPPLAAVAPGRFPTQPMTAPPAPQPIVAQGYDVNGMPIGMMPTLPARFPAPPAGLRPAPAGFEPTAFAQPKDPTRTPKVRGVAPEPTPLVMPSPEQLGVTRSAGAVAAAPAWTPPASNAAPPAPSVDWNATHARLRQLGAVAFHLDRVGQGYRVTCLLPAGREGVTHQIESEAANEAAAVQQALQRAEAYVAR